MNDAQWAAENVASFPPVTSLLLDMNAGYVHFSFCGVDPFFICIINHVIGKNRRARVS